MMFSTAAAEYMDDKKKRLRATTLEGYRSAIRCHHRLGCCARASRVSEAEDGYQGHGIHVASLRKIGRRGCRAVRLRKTLFLD